MSPKMFIPCTVTLTEKEYIIIQQLAQTLAPSDYAFSAALRQVIAEWHVYKKSTADQETADCDKRTKDS